ncbi:MAG: molybdate ABC transporter substrate-binding protein [Pirellulaceae bacterium]
MAPISSQRRAVTSLATMIVVSLVILAVLIGLLVVNSRKRGRHNVKQLLVYCAAGMRYPMEEIVADYRRECDVNVTVQYGGSNTLLSQLEVSRMGDLFLAADDSYIRLADEKGLIAEVIPLATMQPVIVSRKDRGETFAALDDLLQPGVRIACGNPDATAIGKMSRKLLEQSGHWSSVERQINAQGVFKPTVNEVANDVKLGSVDAGIVWDTTAAQYPELVAVHVPQLDSGRATVDIAVLNAAPNPAAALHFARYVAARDRGLKIFESKQYRIVEGDVWKDVPQITFFAGSVNRRALEPILSAFQQREGVDINTVYNGCGILTGQMRIAAEDKGSGFPDTYMACDVYYLDTVKDWFQDAVNVSDTDIVIAVQKGNPKAIESLHDLTKPGVRVAVGQPDQCTIGVLTRRLLEHEGLYEQLLKENVVTQTATSALLVPAVTAKSADAALAYRTDTLAEKDKIDVVTIASEMSKAIQPYSIARSSDHKELGRRLYRAIARSRGAFEAAGFHWRLADESGTTPEHVVSDSVVPDSVVPDSVVPDSVVPDSAVPQQVAPQ